MNARELGTVLAALRLWQANVEDFQDPSTVAYREIMDVATVGGKFRELSSDEIDDLIVRLNVGAYEPDDDAPTCPFCEQQLPDDHFLVEAFEWAQSVIDDARCGVCGDFKPICECVVEARLESSD